MAHYSIRKGNGNDGTWEVDVVESDNINEAIIRAREIAKHDLSRHYYRSLCEEGDDLNYYLTVYPTKNWSAFGASPYYIEIRKLEEF